MKSGKLVTFNILAFLTSLQVLYLYFGRGANEFSMTSGYLTSILSPFFTILVLFILALFVNLSYVAVKAKTRKNLLRISMLALVIMIIVSVIGRGFEIMDSYFCISCWFVTILYLLMLIVVIMILKDLYKLVKELTSR